MKEIKVKKDRRCFSCRVLGIHQWEYKLKLKEVSDKGIVTYTCVDSCYISSYRNLEKEIYNAIKRALNKKLLKLSDLRLVRSCERSGCDYQEIAKIDADYDYYTMTFEYFSGKR